MKISSIPRLLIALLIGLVISVLLGRFIYSVETQVIQAEFEKDVISERLAIEQEVALNFLAIQSLKNFYDNSQYLDPNEFKQFASTLLHSHTNITALSWVPKITAATRTEYDSTFSYFERQLHITKRDENKQLVPAPQRATYFPISYIEPVTGNENALGFNLASNPKRLNALNLAQETGKLAITASIQLVQDKGVRKSFLAVIPIYTKTEQPTQEIAGYIAGVFQISALINNALKNTAEHNINLTLFDLTESEPETLHNTHPEFSFIPDITVSHDLRLVGGRKWAIKASPARSYIFEKRSRNPFIIFILTLTFFTSSLIYIYRLQKQSEITEKAVEKRTLELKEAKNALERIALLDEMTGVANRRHFDNYFMKEWKRGLREQTPVTLIVIDIDFFKQFNDNYGHLAGDECIQQVAKGLDSTLRRSSDLLARYGGEEFAIIAPNTSNGFILSELCRKKIESLAIPHPHSEIADTITVSAGFATLIPSSESNPGELFKMADQALYKAKSSGRNQSASS